MRVVTLGDPPYFLGAPPRSTCLNGTGANSGSGPLAPAVTGSSEDPGVLDPLIGLQIEDQSDHTPIVHITARRSA
jgi:hypothetical protein